MTARKRTVTKKVAESAKKEADAGNVMKVGDLSFLTIGSSSGTMYPIHFEITNADLERRLIRIERKLDESLTPKKSSLMEFLSKLFKRVDLRNYHFRG